MPPSLDDQYDRAKRKRRLAQGRQTRGTRPVNSRPGHCWYCQAAVLWGKLPTRRWIALDPAPVDNGRYAKLSGDRAIELPPGATTLPEVPRHHAHRITCTGGHRD